MEKKLLAITGPSGAGKTTLGDLLIERNQFKCPIHTTTRNPRSDDKLNFYNYLSHFEFNKNVQQNNFLFWSGDGEIITKENGNYYGILNSDYEAVKTYDNILMFISYKDILNILSLKIKEYKIDIINLYYNDLEKNMSNRLLNSGKDHTIEDIKARIICAKEYEEKFKELISSLDILRIPTDIYGIEDTYNIVRKKVLK